MPEDERDESYVSVVVRHWRAVLWTWLCGSGAIVGLTAVSVLHWPGWAFLLVAAAGLSVAQWRAWRDMRIERDGALVTPASDRTTSARAALIRNGVQIHTAQYGVGPAVRIVTNELQSLIADGTLTVYATHHESGFGGEDPCVGIPKVLAIDFAVDGKRQQSLCFNEGDLVELPVPASGGHGYPCGPGSAGPGGPSGPAGAAGPSGPTARKAR